MRRIWLIGGTQESAALARAIAQANLSCTVTITTESARSLYPVSSRLCLQVGRLQAPQLPEFLHQHNIGCILDASHPFAVEISQLAIATASQFQLPYLRYERSRLPADGLDPPSASEGSATLPNFAALLATDWLLGQRVLLTIGYRPLALFREWQTRSMLFARILPSTTALEAAVAAGFTSDRLITLRPPISAELERSLWQQWQISLVVTKASGAAGGEDVKRQVAAELGVKLVRIDRPPVLYPQQTSDLATALTFCQTHTLPIHLPPNG